MATKLPSKLVIQTAPRDPLDQASFREIEKKYNQMLEVIREMKVKTDLLP